MGEYSPYNKGIELESNLLLNLSVINPERSLETHKISHPEKSLRNQDMVIWDRHSFTFTPMREGMVAYTSSTT